MDVILNSLRTKGLKLVDDEKGYIDCVVKCKWHHEVKKSGKEFEEFTDKTKELEGCWVCWEA